jgi:hypothetical protein
MGFVTNERRRRSGKEEKALEICRKDKAIKYNRSTPTDRNQDDEVASNDTSY